MARRRRPLVRGDAQPARRPGQPLVGRRRHRDGDRGPRRHPRRGDGPAPATTWCVRQSRRAVDWTWGHHHRLDLENQTLGQSDIGLVQWLFNRGGYEVGGGGEIVNATGWNAAADGYEVTAAPSMRMVVSLADLDDSRWVNLTGTSGHAFSGNYVDQTELWAEGRTPALAELARGAVGRPSAPEDTGLHRSVGLRAGSWRAGYRYRWTARRDSGDRPVVRRGRYGGRAARRRRAARTRTSRPAPGPGRGRRNRHHGPGACRCGRPRAPGPARRRRSPRPRRPGARPAARAAPAGPGPGRRRRRRRAQSRSLSGSSTGTITCRPCGAQPVDQRRRAWLARPARRRPPRSRRCRSSGVASRCSAIARAGRADLTQRAPAAGGDELVARRDLRAVHDVELSMTARLRGACCDRPR